MKKHHPPPLAILAELTHRCPLRCGYCSNPLELSRRSSEMDTQAWLGLLDEAAALGVLQVHFSGGEPAARPDLDIMVEHAEKVGLYSNLITSGVLLDRDRLESLAAKGLQHVQLSFQGAEPLIADHIGGYPGGHEKKLEIARWVGEIGLPLTVNAVMCRENLHQLDAMIELATSFGAQRLEVANVQYYGWGLLNRAALLPTREQLDKATATVEAARERLKGVLVIDYVVPDYYARRPKSCMGGWGQSFLNINPEGRVLPCHAAESIPGLEFERVGDRPLVDIWRDGPAFTKFRGTGWMPEPCISCDRREVDWGGCRCQAMAVAGHADVADPACELSPDHDKMLAIAASEATGESEAYVYRRIGGPAQ
ncbi:MAG: pyrroloquinoline quinone biosynthesis protein PqqE [Alphaproteobacteria bacterium]